MSEIDEEEVNDNENENECLISSTELEFATRTTAKEREKAAVDGMRKASKKRSDNGYVLWVGGLILAMLVGFAIQVFVPDMTHAEVNDPYYISTLNGQGLGWKAGAMPALEGLTVDDIRNLGGVQAHSNSLCP